MSRTRITRSSMTEMRSLSGSEGEEDNILVGRLRRTRKGSSDINSNYGLTRKAILSETNSSANVHLQSNNHSQDTSYTNADINNRIATHAGFPQNDYQRHATESSTLDQSSVQDSLFDRFRWFLWRCIYLKIIRVVNFDVWFLSRVHNHGKHRAICLFLLPLLLYILWGVLSQNTFSNESVSESSLSPILSLSYFSSFFNLFTSKEDLNMAYNTNENQTPYFDSTKLFSYISSLSPFSFFAGWFSKNLDQADEEIKYSFEYNKESTDALHKEREKSAILIRNEIKSGFVKREKMLEDKIRNLHLEFQLESKRILEDEIRNLKLEFQSLSKNMEKLKEDILKQKENTQTVVVQDSSEQLNLKLKTIAAELSDELKTSFDDLLSKNEALALMEKQLVAAFKKVIDADSNPNSKYYFFNQFLNTKFFSHDKLMQEINAALQKHALHQENVSHDFVVKVVESTVSKYVESIKTSLKESKTGSYFSLEQDLFSVENIKKIVKEAIMLYDADKTGQADYALESGGGSVLGTRCTETYTEKYGKFSIFGLPLWTNSNSPRTAIQPDMQPGKCWGFKGSQGFLVLELSAIIYPTGFTMEHIPVSLSPTGSIDSAPKNFTVWGLESEKDSNGTLLGEFSYDINRDPLQYFPVQKPSAKPYNYIELQIHSNHGNMEYTCLYRFRVHGKKTR